MLTWFDVYLWTRLDVVSAMFVITAITGLGLLPVYTMLIDIFKWKELKKYFFAQLAIGLLSAFFAMAIPDSKDFALIYVLPKIVNNEKVQQIPEKLLDLANKKFEEMLAGDGDKK